MKLRILVVLSLLLVFVQASNAQLFQRRDSSILNKERQKFRINTESKYVERSLEYMGYDDDFFYAADLSPGCAVVQALVGNIGHFWP